MMYLSHMFDWNKYEGKYFYCQCKDRQSQLPLRSAESTSLIGFSKPRVLGFFSKNFRNWWRNCPLFRVTYSVQTKHEYHMPMLGAKSSLLGVKNQMEKVHIRVEGRSVKWISCMNATVQFVPVSSSFRERKLTQTLPSTGILSLYLLLNQTDGWTVRFSCLVEIICKTSLSIAWQYFTFDRRWLW
jgi:hypothetical protein